MRIATNNWRRWGGLAAQMKPAHPEIEHTPDDWIEFISPRPWNSERAYALLREETHPM